MATIGAGACTYIVGPVTGSALGVSSDVIAISIAAGVVKTIIATIGTPLLAKYMKLDNAKTALVFGGLIGTTSGVTAGLAATNPKLVPYGALRLLLHRIGVFVMSVDIIYYINVGF